MDVIRVIVCIALFSISSYLVFDLYAHGFNWVVLLVCIGGYFLVHHIWPRRSVGESHWYDVLEIVFDLPYRTIAFFLRSIGRVARSADADIDL